MTIKKEYPKFLIDTSRREGYEYPYITCLDESFGYVARVLYIKNKDAYQEFVDNVVEIENGDISGLHIPVKKGGVIFQVVNFLYGFELTAANKQKIKALLREGFEKYLKYEAFRTPKGDLGIDNQIKQLQSNLERALEKYDDLVERSNGDTERADFVIDLTRETLRSLEQYREMKMLLEMGPDFSSFGTEN